MANASKGDAIRRHFTNVRHDIKNPYQPRFTTMNIQENKENKAVTMRHGIMHSARQVCATLIMTIAGFVTTANAQEVIRISGTVLSKDSDEPLMGVNISDANTKRALASTDIDGRFAFNVYSNATLRFSMVGTKPKNVKLKSGQTNITVKLEEDDIALKEIVVQTKRITDKILPEATDIVVKGNYLHVSTRVRVPREMFAHNTRLVVQPVLNNVTRGKLTLMRPMVYDAQEYNETQDRMYFFNMNDSVCGDPLAKYVTVKSETTREKGRTNDIIGYNDSIYMENVKDDYSCDVYMAIENYTRILYRDTTIIAKGTVNPLRWLDYSFTTKDMTDPRFLPKPEKQLRNSMGEINLRFPIGKAEFDTADPQNAGEIEKLRRQIESIATSEGASIQSLTLQGTSSPDGKYEVNLRLAKRRMNFASSYIRSLVPESLRQSVSFNSDAKVASWDEVATLLRNDSLDAEASQVESATRLTRSMDGQSQAMRRLPFYKNLLMGKYLPQLRRVDYALNYSIYRELTRDEILALYKKDYKQLSRFEFYSLYSTEPDKTLRERYMREALEVYPSFMAAANDLSASMTSRGTSDETLLEKFVGENAPREVNCNQVVALLNSGHYAKADSVAEFIAKDKDTELLLAVNNVLNGRLDDYQAVADLSPQNECCLLLAMKKNDEAMKVAKQLPDSEALSHYLRAICLNRLNDVVGAYEELKEAFRLNPQFEQVAHIDGDVNNLLLDKEKDNK